MEKSLGTSKEGAIEVVRFQLDQEIANNLAESLKKTGARMATTDELKAALSDSNFVGWVKAALTRDDKK